MSKERIASYKQFAESIEYPMVIFEAETGKVLYINYEAELVIGKQIEHLQMESGRTMVKKDFWEMLHSRKSIMWHRLRLVADEHEYAVSGLINEIDLDGTLVYTVLFESQMKLGSLVLERVLSQAGIVSLYVAKHEQDYRVEFASKNINVYGYTSEQLYDSKISLIELVCEQDRGRVREAIRQAAAKHEEALVLECRMFTEARELVPIRLHVHYVYNEYGNFEAIELLLFDLRDEMYRKNESDYLNHAIDKMKSVVLVKTYKPGKRELAYISSNAGMVGMNVEALKRGYKLTEDYIHPDDRDQVIETIYRAIAGGVTDYVHTYRMVRDDGKQIWVLNELTVNRNEDGEAQISFLLTDITEQKIMEQELAAARESFSDEVMPADNKEIEMPVIEQTDKEVLERLQELTEAINGQTDYYNVVLDTEGHLITKPVGPMKDMGQFYDLVERPQFKEQFAEISERVKEQIIPISTTFTVDMLEVHMVFAPLMIRETVAAYWVLTDFNNKEIIILGDMAQKQWKLANMIAKSFYADEIAERESRLRKFSEMQLDKEQQGRKLMSELMEVMVEKGESAIVEICQKAAFYMDVANIGIYVENKENGNAEKYYTWNHTGEELEFFDKMQMSAAEYKNYKKQMGDRKVLALNSASQKESVKEMLYYSGAKSMLIASLMVGDKVKGYMVFADTVKAHLFEERDMEFGAMVSNLFADMLFRGRKDRNSGISKGSFLEVYEHIREAVFMKDNRAGDIVYANKAMGKLFGYDVVGMAAKDIVYDEMEHYKKMGGVRKRFIANKKVTKWQSYMKELDQIMNIVEVPLDAFDGDYSLIILKKSKNKK
ncbi:MAG: PAS domain-containing protein [Clostridium sp.]|nr:PAS domain-containing protein [Clostridium sp.]